MGTLGLLGVMLTYREWPLLSKTRPLNRKKLPLGTVKASMVNVKVATCLDVDWVFEVNLLLVSECPIQQSGRKQALWRYGALAYQKQTGLGRLFHL